jgi:hypothetical protein
MKESSALDILLRPLSTANITGLSPSARSVSDERHLHCDSALEADVEYSEAKQRFALRTVELGPRTLQTTLSTDSPARVRLLRTRYSIHTK